jgi:intracellular septation protein A
MFKTILLFLIECSPVLSFFVAGLWLPFISATAVYLVTLVGVIIFTITKVHRFPWVPLIFGSVIITSGMLSIYFTNPDILIAADSLYYFMAAAALGYSLRKQTTVMEYLFSSTFSMNKQGWYILTRNWTIVLVLAGLTNEYVRIFYSPEFWITFQFIRSLVLFVFATSQFTVSMKYRNPDATAWGIRTNAALP